MALGGASILRNLVSRNRNLRAIAFVDGQNLFYAARDAFGYTYPNYDPLNLAQAVCGTKQWRLAEVRFYTGIPALTPAIIVPGEARASGLRGG